MLPLARSYSTSTTRVPRPSLTSQAGPSSTEERPKYPQDALKEFSETENFVSLSRDTRLIDYQNAQVILIGAKQGRDVIKNEIGVEIEEKSPQSADIFNKLKIRKDQTPVRPMTEGKLE